MSLWPAVLWSLGRAAVVTAFAVPVALPVAARLRRGGAGPLWAAVLTPVLVPDLLTGYGWGNFGLSLAARPGWNEGLTAVLLWGRCVCVASALLAVAPGPRRTRSSVFLRGLLARASKPRLG